MTPQITRMGSYLCGEKKVHICYHISYFVWMFVFKGLQLHGEIVEKHKVIGRDQFYIYIYI